MEYLQLGDSDVRVSRLAFGAWAVGGWMWGPQDDQQAVEAMQTAIDLGMRTIDTAAVYGFGHSEQLIARAVRHVGRNRVQICTKFGLRWDTDKGVLRFDTVDLSGRSVKVMRYAHPQSVIEEAERSLANLKTDYIDLFQCHWPDPTTPIEETFGAVEKLLRQGKIRAAGVCNFDVEQTRAAMRSCPIASSQPPYSMINRDAEKEIFPFCIENKISILPYSPLQRGLLTGKITPGQKFPDGDHRAINPFFKPQNVERVNRFLAELKPIAASYKVSLAQLVINWTMTRKGVTSVLVGARNCDQVRQNAAAAEFSIAQPHLDQIDELLADVKLEL